VALPCTVKTKSRWAKASKAASGTMHSPDFSSLPENLPSKKPTAFFAISRSGKVIATMIVHLFSSQIGTWGIVAKAVEKRKRSRAITILALNQAVAPASRVRLRL
jgi:hypothetical protein